MCISPAGTYTSDYVGYYCAHHPPRALSVEADNLVLEEMFNTGSQAVTHNDNDIWENRKGCESESQTRRVCSTLHIHVGQPARRLCTLMQPVDHTQISLGSSMKIQWNKS